MVRRGRERERSREHRRGNGSVARDDPVEAGAGDDDARLTWTVRPFETHPVRTAMIPPLVLAAWWFFYEIFGESGLILAILFTLPQVVGYYMSITYSVHHQGIEIRTFYSRGTKPWTVFRGFVPYKDAVHLLYKRRGVRMRVMPGQVLFTRPEIRVELMQRLRHRFPPADDHPGGSGDGHGETGDREGGSGDGQGRARDAEHDGALGKPSANGRTPKRSRREDAEKPLRSSAR